MHGCREKRGGVVADVLASHHHNRFPSLPLHVNLDDVIVISSDC
jgi:hypothetical protein